MATKASTRSAAARKAAATRKANAKKRSDAAKKAAETRRRRATPAKRLTTRPAGGRTTSRRPSGAMDGIALIENDHRTVDELFTRYENLRDSGTPRQKRQLVERMVKELSIHASIEENELYPLIRAQVPGGEAQVTEGLREHQEAKEVLAELDRMDGEDPNLDGKVMTLIADVRHHVEEEESEVLPKLRRSLDRTALRELGDALRKAKRTAPTRPHPHAPDQPPASAVAGKMAGLVDRTRDVLGGRESA